MRFEGANRTFSAKKMQFDPSNSVFSAAKAKFGDASGIFSGEKVRFVPIFLTFGEINLKIEKI